MKKALKIIFPVLAILAGAAAFVAGRYYVDNKKPNFTEEYVWVAITRIFVSLSFVR